MLTTEFGMKIDTRLVHLLKAETPIVVTESGIVMDTRLVHCSKEESMILVTESEIATDTRLVHRPNAKAPMLVTVSGITSEDWLIHGKHCTVPRGLFSPGERSVSPKPKQLGRATSPIVVTESGILIDTRLEHFSKQYPPMLVT